MGHPASPISWLGACVLATCSLMAIPGSLLAQEKGKPAADVQRAVKLLLIRPARLEQQREFIGVIQPVHTWTMGFQVKGRISQVLLREGELVKKGQLLAYLDKTPFKLSVATAEANLRDAIANLGFKRDRLEAQNKLKQRGFASQRVQQQAASEVSAAETLAESRKVALELAQRDLKNTDLFSPEAGVIAKRFVEPFVDVTGGQPVMRIDDQRNLQVVLQIPVPLLRYTKLGDKVTMRANGDNYSGAISEIGSLIEAGDAFKIVVRIDAPGPLLRAGMTAYVNFRFSSGNKREDTFPIPLRAMVPGSARMEGFVFKYDRKSGTIQKVPVRISNISDNTIEIKGGLKNGDLVAVAGVAFLANGQKVSVFNPDVLKTGGASQSADVTGAPKQ